MKLEKTVLFAIGIYWVTSVTGVQDAIAANGTKLLATELSITRLQYEGGGDWYANPSSLPNLLAYIVERTSLPISQEL